jgi:hypothetical protein
MLYSEFLNGTESTPSDATAYAYDVINKMYMADKLTDHKSCYDYYKSHKGTFTWVNDLDIGHGFNAKKSSNLNELITEQRAKEIINKEFCFELDKIEIVGCAYFDVWDFNHIVFTVKGYPRAYNNGQLYDIYC